MPHDVARKLLQAVEARRIELKIAKVTTCMTASGGNLHFHLTTGETLSAERVVLATGFDQARPGSSWLDAAIAEEGLPCASCSYPILDQTLAANICGARLAAARLLQSIEASA